jgi:hypothetical protein
MVLIVYSTIKKYLEENNCNQTELMHLKTGEE